jgi:hypothetical protein
LHIRGNIRIFVDFLVVSEPEAAARTVMWPDIGFHGAVGRNGETNKI